MAQDKSNQSNKNKGGAGLLAFITGAVAGAAAVFFSKKENRDKTKKVVDQTVEKAKDMAEDVAEQSQTMKKKAEAEMQKVAKKVEQAKRQVEKKV